MPLYTAQLNRPLQGLPAFDQDLPADWTNIADMFLNITIAQASRFRITGYMDTRYKWVSRTWPIMVAFQLTLGSGVNNREGQWIAGTKVGANIVGTAQHYSGPLCWNVAIDVSAGTYCVSVKGKSAASRGGVITGGVAECKDSYNILQVEVGSQT